TTCLQRGLHRRQEPLAVVLESVRAADRAPNLGLSALIGFELEGQLEQGQALLDLVPPNREIGGASQPRNSFATQAGKLAFLACPHKVDVLRPGRLGVVVSEERGVLVTTAAEALKPVGEAGVKARTPRAGQSFVGHLARERMLEGEFRLA